MRDIEFRGKKKSDGKWYYGDLILYHGEASIHNGWDRNFNQKSGSFEIYSEDVFYETVGQFTGLKDKNGVRIFEGDIVNIKYDYCENGVAKVIFDNGQFIGISIDGCDETINHAKFPVEVIGNIHDNPDLLRGQ